MRIHRQLVATGRNDNFSKDNKIYRIAYELHARRRQIHGCCRRHPCFIHPFAVWIVAPSIHSKCFSEQLCSVHWRQEIDRLVPKSIRLQTSMEYLTCQVDDDAASIVCIEVTLNRWPDISNEQDEGKQTPTAPGTSNRIDWSASLCQSPSSLPIFYLQNILVEYRYYISNSHAEPHADTHRRP